MSNSGRSALEASLKEELAMAGWIEKHIGATKLHYVWRGLWRQRP
jgi:hypothetical protein